MTTPPDHDENLANAHAEAIRRVAQLEAEQALLVNALAAQQRRERDYRELIDVSPEPIAIHDGGRLVQVNQAAARLIGATAIETLIGRSIFDFIHPDYREMVLERARRTQQQGQVAERAELRFQRIDGTNLDVSTLAIPIVIAGRPMTQVFIDDITSKKRNEAALHFLAEASSALTASLDLTTTLTLVSRLIVPDLADCCIINLFERSAISQAAIAAVNPAYEGMLRDMLRLYPPTSTSPQLEGRVLRSGRAILLGTIPDDVLVSLAENAQHVAALKQLGPQSAISAPLVARGDLIGTITLISTQLDHRYDQADLWLAIELARRVAAAADNARLYRDARHATQKEHAARNRAESAEHRQAFLAQAIALLSSTTDYDQRLEQLTTLIVPSIAHYCVVDIVEDDSHISRATAAHSDPACQSLLDELQERYPPDWNAPHPAANALRTGHVQHAATLDPASTRDAEHLRILMMLGTAASLALPLQARGRMLGAITLVRAPDQPDFDNDDQSLVAELASHAAFAIDNARLYRASVNAVRARDQFLSVASHELKTPLTTLLGNAQLLERRMRDSPNFDPRAQRSVNLIIDQSRRLNRMITALLDLSRSESGELQIDHAPVDLVALTRRITAELQFASENHELQLDLPETPLIIEGDELRLEQVLQNLIQNALKYSPSGGRIDIQVAQHADVAKIVVADQGIGIPAAALPLLFHRFYRAANAEPKRINGMGIGLFVVKQIITLHGGQVEVTSTEGQGSSFTVILPITHLAA